MVTVIKLGAEKWFKLLSNEESYCYKLSYKLIFCFYFKSGFLLVFYIICYG